MKPQATFDNAYLVTEEYSTNSYTYNKGAAIPKAQATALSDLNAEQAYVCTSTIQLSATEFITAGDLMTSAKKIEYYNRFYKDGEGTNIEKAIAKDINDLILPAYYCTSPIKGETTYQGPYYYGGSYYNTGENYRGRDAWSAMPASDRANFAFNYDALDLLIDPDYSYGFDKNGNYTLR